jgi:hypothetical protein
MNQKKRDTIDECYGALPVYQALRASLRKLLPAGTLPAIHPAEFFQLCFSLVDSLLDMRRDSERARFAKEQWDELAHQLTTDQGLTAEEKDINRAVGAVYMGAAQLLVRSGKNHNAKAYELIHQLPGRDANTSTLRDCFSEAFNTRKDQVTPWLAEYVEGSRRITDEIANITYENPTHTTMEKPNNIIYNYGGTHYNQGAAIEQQIIYAANDTKQQVNANTISTADSTDEKLKTMISKLMDEKDSNGKYVFSQKQQWYAVYRIMADHHLCRDNDLAGFCRRINDLHLPLRVGCDNENLKKVNAQAPYFKHYDEWEPKGNTLQYDKLKAVCNLTLGYLEQE